MQHSPHRGRDPYWVSGWIIATFLLGFLLDTGAAVGQESGAGAEDEEQPTAEELQQEMNEQVLNYLISEKVVVAGVGFISAQIGDPMSSVLNIWGEPLKMRKTGLLGDTEFMYQTDPNVAIVFTGDDYVKSISIKGNSAAMFRTRRGARLGMRAIDIARIYSGAESETVRNRFEFRELGIDFHFMDSKLDKVVVYEPK